MDIIMIRPQKTSEKHKYPEYGMCKEIIRWAKVIRDSGYNPKFVCHELEEPTRRDMSAKKDTLVG